MEKWDEYTRARDRMFAATHKPRTPWTVALFNDKRRGRLAVIRRVLSAIPYRGKDARVVGRPDPAILGAPSLLNRKRRAA
jgi:hypothetical protein